MFSVLCRLVWMGAALCVGAAPAFAQVPKYNELKVEAIASGEELAAQPDLWVMEVYFKPMRMIAIDLTDPKTGQKRPEFVWYITYRAINRKLAVRPPANTVVNELDAPVIPQQFIPEFTLVTTDTAEPKIYRDEVIPEAIAVINQRERGTFKSTVNVVGDVPPAAAPKSPEEKVIYGVATWRGIDPEADLYTVFMTGFSNGLKKTPAPDGTVAVQNKTIQTKYWRPGDRFDQKEPEIRLDPGPAMRAGRLVNAKNQPLDAAGTRDGLPQWIWR
jgi:hypothetical protein